MLALFVVGLLSLLVQVVLLRELSVAFYGVELIYALALAVWLLWTALGALISRKSLNPSHLQLGILFALCAVVLPLDLAFIRSIRLIFAPAPGAYLPFPIQVLSMSLSLLPVGLIVGLQFQWAAKIYVTAGKSLALAYAIESAGGLAGGACATWLFKAGIGSLTLVLLCAGFAAATAYLLTPNASFGQAGRFQSRSAGRVSGPAPGQRPGLQSRECARVLHYALLPFAALLVYALWMAPRFDRLMTAWNHPYLLDTRDSPYSRVTVTSYAGQISVFENDALSFDTEGTEAEELVHVAALQHPNPARVLILGGGIEGTVREMMRHSPKQVDYVELNPVLLSMVKAHVPSELRASFDTPDVRVFIADPRRFLSNSRAYDLILVGMPEPTSGQSNRFYTRDFFGQCAARLNPGGLLGFRLRSSENLWTPQLKRRNASIYRALKLAFRDVQVLPGSTNIFLASAVPMTRDPVILAERYRDRGIKARLVSPSYIRYLYNNDRFRQVAEILEHEDAAPNTDARPICYQYTIMLWLSRFLPSLAFSDMSAPASPEKVMRSPWMALVLAVPLVFLLARRKPSRRRALLAASAGFLGMVIETLLILHYQVKSGVLFQDLGTLLMSFMAGLALGAWVADRLAARGQGLPWRWGAAFLAGFAVLGIWLSLRTRFGMSVGLWETGTLLLLAGSLVSGIFAYASFQGGRDQRCVVAPMYSADLIGGCVGSIAGALFLIPIAGLAVTAELMVPVAVMSALLL